MTYIAGSVLVLIFGLWFLTKIGVLHPWNEYSGDQVKNILESFLNGNPNEWAYDDFVSIRIKDRELDKIRNEFRVLAAEHPRWDTTRPFPDTGIPALKKLISQLEKAT